MTLNLSSSCIDIVIRSVTAIETPRAGQPAAEKLTRRESGQLNLARSGHYNLATTHFRRVSTRYDKLADSFLAFASLACAFGPIVNVNSA
jgi:hypothetical protein